jgi:Fe-S cluster biogenesis protein NfuA
MTHDDRTARDCVAQVESRLERVEGLADAPGREAALACIQAVLAMYGLGLERIVTHIATECDEGTERRLAAALARDELVSHLLMLHGLHPESVRSRVERALEAVRPSLGSHGGNVELIGIDGATVRLRLQGSCHGCPSSSATLRTTVEDAILAAAPEVMRIETDDAPAQSGDRNAVLVPLVRSRNGRAAAAAVGSIA